MSGALNQAAKTRIILSGGALPKNIVWAVAGPAVIGQDALFAGTILGQTSVVLHTGAIDNGCIYTQAAVVLETAKVLCSLVDDPPTPTATATPQCAPTATGVSDFTTEFQGLNASVQGGHDYLTFKLADTVDGV